MAPALPIPELRDMTSAIYQRVPFLLRLVDRHTSAFLKPADPRWQAFQQTLPIGNGRGANANNVRSSLRTLGLLDDMGLTPLGQEISRLRGRTGLERAKVLLAKRLILERNGWAFCHALEIVGGQGREAIWDFYREAYDPDPPAHYDNITDINKLLVWAGVSTTTFTLNRPAFDAMAGVRLEDLRGIARLKPDTKLCLRALLTLSRTDWHTGKEIQEAASMLVGRAPSVHAMQAHAKELVQADLIEYGHKGVAATAVTAATGVGTAAPPRLARGRTGQWRLKPSGVLDQLTTDFAQVYLAHDPNWDLTAILEKSFSQLWEQLNRAPTIDAQARALELIAGKLCWILGLRRIRVRTPDEVRGIEADVVADRRVPHYQRFLVQCKKQASALGPPIIAKELGTASVLHIENLLFVSTGGFTPSARAFARLSMQQTGRNILMLDEADIEAITSDDASLVSIIRRENDHCRAVRQGNPDEWLPFEMARWLEEIIRLRGLTAKNARRAWNLARDAGAPWEASLFPLFQRIFEESFVDLSAGKAPLRTFGA